MSALGSHADGVIHADVLDWLRGNQWLVQHGHMERFHCVFADPPYGIEFMSKNWDRHASPQHYQAWVTEWATLLLDFVYPGALLAMFGGTRTYHRLAAGLEDAGWEVFDCMMYVYGSGFPKAADIGKLIDKSGGVPVGWFGMWLREWRTANGVTQKEVAKLFPSKTGGLTGCVANWELGLNMPTPEQFNTICRHYDLPFQSIEEVERELTGRGKSGKSALMQKLGAGGADRGEFDVTAPSTEAAQRFDGYKTALKPAYEPIILARAPRGNATYAELAQTWGTGAINVDGGRIGTEERTYPSTVVAGGGRERAINLVDAGNGKTPDGRDLQKALQRQQAYRDNRYEITANGRYPANLILGCACEGAEHDETCAVRLLDQQSGESTSSGGGGKKPGVSNGEIIYGKYGDRDLPPNVGLGDSGGASRFFYTAKAAAWEREKMVDLPTKLMPRADLTPEKRLWLEAELKRRGIE